MPEHIVYLLCFDKALPWGARHYCGRTVNLDKRMKAHGTKRGAKLLSYAKDRHGITWELVRTWTPVTNDNYTAYQLERKVKRRALKKLCPKCTPQPNTVQTY